ncbi:MAG: FMN-dependent NADH-azoreductase [Betaproteobacteria bacterium]|nr:FMN-dependent NADH-azoreductase [Betaproteobacteria bacterium]
MNTLLQLNTSMFSSGGQSSKLAEQFVAAWRTQNPGAQVIVRDIARDPVPHLDAARFQAFLAKPEARTAKQQATVRYSDQLIADLKRAEVIVIGLPMYNFGVPSTLKAYFDHIARAGVTFRYTENGPVGLLTGKRAYVFAARGGKYAGTPHDTQTGYVRDFMRFLGIGEVEFVYAEGLAISDASRLESLARAQGAIERLVLPEPVAVAA